MICVTNREKLDVIFTGNIDLVDESMITSEIMDKFFHAFSSKYDYIILQSDKEGDVAQFCDATVIVTEQEQYNEIASELRVSELDKKGCFVLGVVIDE
jgi:Mrp family chromosome partitioning ATPase